MVDSQQTVRQAGFLNGKPSVNMLIFRQPGANIIKTVDAVQGGDPVAPGHNSAWPAPGHDSLDRTLTIRASVADIERTLMISVMLVILGGLPVSAELYATT